MDTHQLNYFAGQLGIKNFMGTFAVDELLTISEDRCGLMIFNTESSEKKGQHWIAVCISKTNVFYYDSLNLDFIFQIEISNFLLRLKKNVFYNKIITQPAVSNKCGVHCLVFCFHMTEIQSFQRYKQFLKAYIPFELVQRDELTFKYFLSLLNNADIFNSSDR